MNYSNTTGLMIGIPTLFRPVTIEWALAVRGQVPPINFNATMFLVPNMKVAEAREMICEEALKQKTKYIFFIGDDTEPPLHALKQLIFRMENTPDCGVVGGIYCSKSDPPAPLVFRGNGAGSYWDWKVGEFFECTGLGMDCTLIRTEMLEKLPKPWFKTINTDNFLDNKNYAEMWTEDLYFCKQVQEHTEWKIYADASIICNHWDAISHTKYTLPPNSLPMRRLAKKKEKTLLDIGCGHIWREDEECEIVRVDIREDCNPDYRCDIRQLPFDNESFDVIFSSHVLEHFNRADHKTVLEEWLRVLKVGGEARICVPSIEWAAKEIVAGRHSYDVMNVLYGQQSYPHDFHYNGFTPKSLENLVTECGCKVKSCITDDKYNILLTAEKE